MSQLVMFAVGLGLGLAVCSARTVDHPAIPGTVRFWRRQASKRKRDHPTGKDRAIPSKERARPTCPEWMVVSAPLISSVRRRNFVKKIHITVMLITISIEAGVIVALFVALGDHASPTSLVLDGLSAMVSVFSLGISSAAFFLE